MKGATDTSNFDDYPDSDQEPPAVNAQGARSEMFHIQISYGISKMLCTCCRPGLKIHSPTGDYGANEMELRLATYAFKACEVVVSRTDEEVCSAMSASLLGRSRDQFSVQYLCKTNF